MNNITKILKEKLKNGSFDDDYLYLLYGFNESIGFFYNEGKILFMVKSSSTKNNDTDTDYLYLRANVPVKRIKGENNFEEGLYDFLGFRESVDHHYFDTFVSLCDSYVKNFDKMSFIEFCDTMFSLFKISSVQADYNFIGLYGELSFILNAYNENNINIAKNWHKSGSNSKYDFTFEDFNIEVKTSESRDDTFVIKHDQLFNDDKIYVVVINIENNPSGKSLQEIFDILQNSDPFASDFNFQIKLAKEFTRISKSNFYNKIMKVLSIHYYDKDELQSLLNIPDSISKISYHYNFKNQKEVYQDELLEIIKKGLD